MIAIQFTFGIWNIQNFPLFAQQIVYFSLDFLCHFSAEYKDVDADHSENRHMTTGLKFDSQTADVSSTTPEGSGNDDKPEPSQSNNGKTICKSNNVSIDANCQKLPTNSDSSSTVINRIPKSEHQFRDDAPSAIIDTNNDISDSPTTAVESDTAEVEIKQEESYQSPSTSLPPHAVSKIQVRTKQHIHFTILSVTFWRHFRANNKSTSSFVGVPN